MAFHFLGYYFGGDDREALAVMSTSWMHVIDLPRDAPNGYIMAVVQSREHLSNADTQTTPTTTKIKKKNQQRHNASFKQKEPGARS